MADELTQRLGFDASGAIKSITQLISALGNLSKTLGLTQRNLRNFGSGRAISNIDQIQKQLDLAQRNLGRFSNRSSELDSVNRRIRQATQNTRSLTLSWETLSRIFIAQVVVRSINVFNTQLREAVALANSFNLALTEAAAIAPGGVEDFAGTVNRLNRELIETSRSFGFDVLDLAEARYQEFSNQVRGSAESNRLFTSANVLARISASEVGESVGALSSVLNSYSLSVENADQVSAALFKTIELGRLRLSDVADQLGNVTPLARDAGIAFEEVFGALTTITRTGVSPSRSLTQIRALINQLQKPTDELQELFTETFQVQNAQEALDRFGSLQGVITAIADAAEGNSQRIAQFFSNIRARNAFLSLSGQAQLLGENIEAISQASAEGTQFLDRLLENFDEQPAIRFQKALNELKLEFLDLAQDLLPTITFLIEDATVAFENWGSSLGVLVSGGLVLFATRTVVANGVLKTFTASTVASRAALLGFGAAAGFAIGEVGRFIAEARVDRDLAAPFQALENIRVDAVREIQRETQEATEALREFGEVGTRNLQIIRGQFRGALSAVREENDVFVETTTQSLNRLVETRADFVRGLERVVQTGEQRITQNLQEQTDLRNRIADGAFERRISGFDEVTQATLRQQRAQEVLNNALTTDQTEDGLQERVNQLERAEQLAESAVDAARQTDNRTALFLAERTLDEVLRSQLRTKQQQAELDQQQLEAAEARAAEERQNLESLRDNVQTLTENLSIFTETGALLPPEQRRDAARQVSQALNDIQQDAFARSDLDVGELLGLADLQLRFNQILGGLDVQGPRNQLINQIETITEGVTAQIPIEFITEQAAEFGIQADIDPLQPLGGIQEIRQQIQQAIGEEIQLQERLNSETAQTEENLGRVLAQVQRISDFNLERIERGAVRESGVEEVVQATLNFREEIGEVLSRRLLSDEDVAEAEQILRDFNNQLDARGGDLPGLPFFGETATINQFIESLLELQQQQRDTVDLQGQLNRSLGEQAQLESLNQTINNALGTQRLLTEEAGDYSQSANQGIEAQGELNNSIGAGVNGANALQQGYNGVTRSINQAIDAQNQLNRAQSGGGAAGAVPRMFGGFLYRAAGGLARGTDTIPAMLSPGEFVVNARSARRFASQLVAINAGVQPVYRQDGGTVVNNSVNVGDINVNGTSNPEDTARQVVSQLRREFRRGSAPRLR